MAARKDPEDRVRANKPGYVPPNQRKETFELPEWDGVTRGPELDEGTQWSDQTRAWWQKWRDSPQAMLCSDVDWESMKIAAIIHNRIMNGVSDTALSNLTGELRKREGMFGASVEDRQRLNMSTPSPIKKKIDDQKINDEVNRTVNYFERLSPYIDQMHTDRTRR